MESTSLEEALARFERDAAAVAKTLAAATREVKKLEAAAAVGDLRALRSGADASARLSEHAAQAVCELRDSWQFDEAAHFDDGGFTKEVLALAAEEGLKAFESDERLLSYPAIVRIIPAEASVLIDKKRDRRVRPSVLVRTLKALQQRPPRFKAEAFLESLANAYDLVVGTAGRRPESTEKLLDIYSVLTLMPGAARDYTKQEFARDLYLLDQSGVVTTKAGRTLSLPASALTRGAGVLTTVSRNGQAKVYAGIRFAEPVR
ncbi:MAG: hypothetical protein ABIR68_08735 [Ilumatobacteraceae bacterium]